MKKENQTDRMIREPECFSMTSLSRTTRWRMEKSGNFPARIRMSPNSVGWKLSELTTWMDEISNS
jgi:prophage regulatory protein